MGMRTAYLGVHTLDIPAAADLSLGMQWNYVIQILYNPILALVKSSVLLFLLRFSGHRRSVKYCIHVLNIFNLALMLAIFLVVIFQCTPIAYFWQQLRDPTASGTCIDSGLFVVSTAGLTILTDVLVLALPLWIFLGLQMKWKAKLAVISVFLLGGVYVTNDSPTEITPPSLDHSNLQLWVA